MGAVTCDRCGKASPTGVRGPGGAIAKGWSKLEALREDGDTVFWVTVCPDCLTEAEDSEVWPISPTYGHPIP